MARNINRALALCFATLTLIIGAVVLLDSSLVAGALKAIAIGSCVLCFAILVLHGINIAALDKLTKQIEKLAHRLNGVSQLHRPGTTADVAVDVQAFERAFDVQAFERAFESLVVELQDLRFERKMLVEKTQDLICSVDQHEIFLRVNAASNQILGYAPCELIGKSFNFLLPPGDASADSKDVKKFAPLVANSSAAATFENEVVRSDGQTITLLWSAYWSHTEQCFACVAHDITNRKMAEQQLADSERKIRLIIDNLPVAMVAVDQRNIIQIANQTAHNLFRYPAQDLLDKPINAVLPSKHPEENSSLVAIKGVRADASVFPGEIFTTSLETKDGPLRLITIIDTTERERVQQLKRELIEMISHDLRTPLASLKMTLKLFAAGAFGQQSERALKRIDGDERNCTRLIGLINDMLDLEKLESGKLEIEPSVISLYPIVERAIESVAGFAEEKKIEIEAGKADIHAFADEKRLGQVLVNLLGNAIKFSPRESKVVVSICALPGYARIEVADQGRGIPIAERNTVFERFRQVRAEDSELGGSGLGLAICKAIVLEHGGNIGVDSKEGQGSTFWLTLPAQEVKSDELLAASNQ